MKNSDNKLILTYMCGDQGSRIGQLVMPPHPEREEDDSHQAYDGNQRVEQSAEELGLLGKWVGGGCAKKEREMRRWAPKF